MSEDEDTSHAENVDEELSGDDEVKVTLRVSADSLLTRSVTPLLASSSPCISTLYLSTKLWKLKRTLTPSSTQGGGSDVGVAKHRSEHLNQIVRMGLEGLQHDTRTLVSIVEHLNPLVSIVVSLGTPRCVAGCVL